MGRDRNTLLRKFHQARWDEQLFCEMGIPGERGILVPTAEEEVRADVGDGFSTIPDNLRRKVPPALPEVNQVRVLRHYMRLSQETMGTDVTIDISQGTCTMKYSPKVQEHLCARNPGMTEIHPLQDEDTLQGILAMYYMLEQFFKEISGLDYFSSSPVAGPRGSTPTRVLLERPTKRAVTLSGTRLSQLCSPIRAMPPHRQPRGTKSSR